MYFFQLFSYSSKAVLLTSSIVSLLIFSFEVLLFLPTFLFLDQTDNELYVYQAAMYVYSVL